MRQIQKDVCGYFGYLFCLKEVLNNQEKQYFKTYRDIRNNKSIFLDSLCCFELCLSNQQVWILLQETKTQMVQEGG